VQVDVVGEGGIGGGWGVVGAEGGGEGRELEGFGLVVGFGWGAGKGGVGGRVGGGVCAGEAL
jgi:hypothetical protein